MPQTGFLSWRKFNKPVRPVWISGRELDTAAATVLPNARMVLPPTGGGVPTGLGYFHQTMLGSTFAPIAVSSRPSMTVEIDPSQDEETHAHIERVHHAAAVGQALIWFPWADLETWLISTGRINYTTSHTIAGSAGLRPGGYFDPIVLVTATAPAGNPIETLTLVASSPSVNEFALSAPDTDDQDQIIVNAGFGAANAGKLLSMHYWPLIEISALQLDKGPNGPGNWTDILRVDVRPSSKDFGKDAP